MSEKNDNAELLVRLRALGLIIKLGDDVGNAADFEAAAALAVNSSRSLLQFKSSVLLERTGGHAKVVGQSGAFDTNPNGELAQLQQRVAGALEFGAGEYLLLSCDDAEKLAPGASAELAALLESGDPIIAYKLAIPPFVGQPGFELIWLIEFVREIPAYAKNAASILARSFGQSLYSRRCCRRGAAQLVRGAVRKYLPWAVVLLALVAAMFIPVREQLSAEFVLKAPQTASGYVWFDGTVARCLRQDGDRVKAGEVIVRYDLNLLKFKLAGAQNQLAEIEKEYDLENRASFVDRTKLGKVKLLEARLASAAVAVREAQWYLEHAEIKAPIDGVLALTDGRAERLENRAVRIGDRIFEVYGGSGMIAEIQVNERESSILAGELTATLFPYTAPERGLRTEIVDVRKVPELTEQRLYCYPVKARVLDPVELRYGMRGIARLQGRRISLGYYLFRNLVIYLRWF